MKIIAKMRLFWEKFTLMHFFVIVFVGKNSFPSDSVVKDLPASAGDVNEFNPGRSLGEVNGTPLQYSCLKNPMDRGAWRAKVHRVAKSQT